MADIDRYSSVREAKLVRKRRGVVNMEERCILRLRLLAVRDVMLFPSKCVHCNSAPSDPTYVERSS